MSKSRQKILAIWLIISLLASFIPNFSVLSIADGTPDVTMYISGTSDTEIEAEVGDKFLVDFGLVDGIENKMAVNLTISYDNTKLQPCNGYESDGSTQYDIETDLGNVAYCIQSADDKIAFSIAETRKKAGVARYVLTEGAFNTLEFEVIGEGETSITVESLKFVDPVDPEEMTFTSNNKLTVKQPEAPATIDLDKTEATIKSTETLTLTATVTGNTTEDVVWTVSPTSSADFPSIETSGTESGKTSVAEIKPNITEGTFKVRAAIGDTYKECTVTVSNYVPLTGITISDSSLTMNTGDTKTLTVTNVPENTTDTVTYEWNVSSGNVTLSSTTGNSVTVTAVNNGEATVTVRPMIDGVNTENMIKTCDITVHTPVTGLRLDFESKTIDIRSESDYSNTVDLHAAKLPDGQDGGPTTDDSNTISWTSSDPSVATVDSNGKVTPVGKGTTTITAKVDNTNVTATCEIKVVVHVQGIEIQNEKITTEATSAEKRLTILKGQSADLTVVFTPDESKISDDVNKTIEWNVASDDAEYVTVVNGKVTAVKGGRDVKVTASIPGTELSDYVIVHVDEVKADTLAFNKTSTTIAMTKDDTSVENEEELYVYLLNSDDNREVTDELEASKVSLTSDNDDFTVTKGEVKTEDGKQVLVVTVTATKPGSAVITASYEGLTSDPTTLSVTVTKELDSINIVNKADNSSIDEDLEIELDENPELAIVIDPTDATVDASSVTWTSDSEDVATVDENGKVTPVKAGTATITAKLGDKTDTVKVKVIVLTDKVEIENEELDVYKGRTLQLNTKASSSKYPNETPTDEPVSVEWTSSDESKATVDENGLVTGVGSDGDTARITVTYTFEDDRTVTDTVTVTVKEVKADSVTVVEKPEKVYLDQDNEAKIEVTVPGSEDTTDPTEVTVEDEDGNEYTPDENGVCKDPETGDPIFEVKVSDDGKTITFKGKKEGKFKVNVSVSGKTDSFDVTVEENPIESITVKPKDTKVVEGKKTSVEVEYTAKDPNAPTTDSTEYTYESSDKSVATIDENGNIKALKKGKTTITVSTAKGIKDTFVLTVEEQPQGTTGGGSGEQGGGTAVAGTTTTHNSPHTGDLNVARYIIIAIISFAGMIIALKRK